MLLQPAPTYATTNLKQTAVYEVVIYEPHGNDKLKAYNRQTRIKEKGIQTSHGRKS